MQERASTTLNLNRSHNPARLICAFCIPDPFGGPNQVVFFFASGSEDLLFILSKAYGFGADSP
jgi:hypothetical protein